jgi:hypothetical protein
MRRFYYENELNAFESIRSGLFYHTLIKAVGGVLFFCGVALLPPLLMFRRVLRDRRTRFLVQCMAVMMTGMIVQIFLIPHYLAPFTVVFYALGLQAMRHLRLARMDGRPVGLGWVRLLVTLVIALAGVRLFVGPLHLSSPEWPASNWSCNWYGPVEFGTKRARIEGGLEQLPGKQLVMVRYSPEHYPLDEWVYNAPDVDGSKVIWAREMDTTDNLELTRYYQDRHVWLVQPDTQPPQVSPYPMPEQGAIASTGTQLPIASAKKQISQEIHLRRALDKY